MSRIKLLFTILTLLLLAAHASAQAKVYTRPTIPTLETLGRMNLSLRWMGKIPTEGAKDGIYSIQILPLEKSTELLIQTRSGLVQMIDGETGDVKWRSSIDMPYVPMQPAAFNSHSVYVFRKDRVYALDRSSGLHRIYSLERGTGFVILGPELYLPPTAPPAADEAALFVTSGERLSAYLMPLVVAEQVKIPSSPAYLLNPPRTLKPSLQPVLFWNVRLVDVNTNQAPVITGNQVGVAGESGILASVNKSRGNEDFRYGFNGPVTVPMGQYGELAYIGSQDYTVYALDIDSQRLVWRFPAGSRITQPVLVTDNDVFVTTKLKGLFRLDRKEGEILWQNPEAEMMLAKNPQFVYATDARGFFLVLDTLRGRTLSRLDLHDFQVPVSNPFTDRIYLANHDGTIFCMHHRELGKPVLNRTLPTVGQPDPEKKVEMQPKNGNP